MVGIATPASALADPTPPATGGGGDCDHNPDPSCITWGNGGGGPGTGGGSGGSGCTWQGQTVPCTDPDFGYYTGNGCYWKAYDPQPAHPPPGGQDPATGKWGVMSCYTGLGSGIVTQVNYWMADPVNGPTPGELAQQALAKIHLLGAQIGVAPRPNGSGAVGLPVWLWTAVTPGTWGPLSASASGGGITVTIEAKASRIVWDMGDGHRVSCANPGTPYEARYGFASSPTCGYVYPWPSVTDANPQGRYTVTATTYWTVTWSGGGQSGVLTPTSQSQTSVRIGEIPVVVLP
ncbi:hypothetical protein [Micromonospora globbae]|uniref:hypothetical protein n=1 Tax=Micromonospora globbae TaxID=1894969 RepID=UPI00343A2564